MGSATLVTITLTVAGEVHWLVRCKVRLPKWYHTRRCCIPRHSQEPGHGRVRAKPVTVGANCCVPPSATVALVGFTCTATPAAPATLRVAALLVALPALPLLNNYHEQRAITVGICRGRSRIFGRSRATYRGSVSYSPSIAERGRARYRHRETRRLPDRNVYTDRLPCNGRWRGRAIAFRIARRVVGARQTCASPK